MEVRLEPVVVGICPRIETWPGLATPLAHLSVSKVFAKNESSQNPFFDFLAVILLLC